MSVSLRSLRSLKLHSETGQSQKSHNPLGYETETGHPKHRQRVIRFSAAPASRLAHQRRATAAPGFEAAAADLRLEVRGSPARAHRNTQPHPTPSPPTPHKLSTHYSAPPYQ